MPMASFISRRKNKCASAARYFAGQDHFVLIAAGAKLLDSLRFEPLRGGALFPHLYANLPLYAFVWAKPLPLLPDGRHDFSGIL
jgi:uncharacterized protein (DUF952 family)